MRVRLPGVRLAVATIFCGMLAVAGCSQPKQPHSGLMWYRKPPKPAGKANSIDVGRVRNPSSIDLVAAPGGATDSADTGMEVRTGGGGLSVGSTDRRALLGDAARSNSVLGPSVGGGVDTAVTGTTLQPAEAVGSTLSVDTAP